MIGRYSTPSNIWFQNRNNGQRLVAPQVRVIWCSIIFSRVWIIHCSQASNVCLERLFTWWHWTLISGGKHWHRSFRSGVHKVLQWYVHTIQETEAMHLYQTSADHLDGCRYRAFLFHVGRRFGDLELLRLRWKFYGALLYILRALWFWNHGCKNWSLNWDLEYDVGQWGVHFVLLAIPLFQSMQEHHHRHGLDCCLFQTTNGCNSCNFDGLWAVHSGSSLCVWAELRAMTPGPCQSALLQTHVSFRFETQPTFVGLLVIFI